MKKFTLYLLFIGFISGCSSSSEEPAHQYLQDYDQVLRYSADDAKLFFQIIGLDTINSDVEHPYNVYKITYNTDFKGEEVLASALVSIPVSEEPMPIISFQHGTIVEHSEAPTENMVNLLPLFGVASTGYIVVVPDFLGFGSSTNIFHPYYVAEPMGRSVTEAILAAKELVAIVEGNFNDEVFLAGYSEGGYATMAAHKYIEEIDRADLELIASAPASGGYDVKGMQEYFFNLETYSEPFYMAYVVLAYKNYYGFDEPLSAIFQEPYASKLEGLFNGQYSGSKINDELTEIVGDYLTEDILLNFETDPKFSELRAALIENSLLEWTPRAPVYLYHGTADVTVPYINTVNTFDALLENTGDPDLIKLFPLEGETHSSGAIPYIKDLYYKFKELK